MRLGLPLACVSYWDASVLLGNGPEGDFTRASGANTLPEPVGQRGHPQCGPAPGTFLPVAGFLLHGSVSSASAFWTPFPLHCFRELCLGLHILSCWMKT